MAPTAEEERQQKKQAAREVIDVLQEIALLLACNSSLLKRPGIQEPYLFVYFMEFLLS